MKRISILLLVLIGLGIVAGCSGPEVSATDVQNNMRAAADAAKENPNGVGTAN